MNPKLLGTHWLLYKWGRWGRGPNLGLPTMSPMFGERCLKSPVWGADAPDPEIELISKAVIKLDPDKSRFVRRKYALEWSVRDFMDWHQWRSPRRYYRELEQTVREVDNLL